MPSTDDEDDDEDDEKGDDEEEEEEEEEEGEEGEEEDAFGALCFGAPAASLAAAAASFAAAFRFCFFVSLCTPFSAEGAAATAGGGTGFLAASSTFQTQGSWILSG